MRTSRKLVAALRLSPYKSGLYLFDDRQSFDEFICKYASREAAGLDRSAAASSFTFADGDCAIGVFRCAHNRDAALVHEISHVIINLFYHIGMDVVPATSEAFCYLQEYLFDKCRSALNDRRRGAKYVR